MRAFVPTLLAVAWLFGAPVEAQVADERYPGLRPAKAAEARAVRSRPTVSNVPNPSAIGPARAATPRAARSTGRVVGRGCSGRAMRAAYYWQGRRTASGQPFRPDGFTAAHRTLPFGTRLTVANPRTGASVGVVVNDRGPFVRGLDIDLSRGAARAIGMTGTGTVCVS